MNGQLDAFGYPLAWRGVTRGALSRPVSHHQLLRSRTHPFIRVVQGPYEGGILFRESLFGPDIQLFQSLLGFHIIGCLGLVIRP